MNRKDYGPQGCAERSGAMIGAMGVGAYLVGLGGTLGWRMYARALQKLEARR